MLSPRPVTNTGRAFAWSERPPGKPAADPRTGHQGVDARLAHRGDPSKTPRRDLE